MGSEDARGFLETFSRPAGDAHRDGGGDAFALGLLGKCGHDVRVADARQLALITNSNAKSDKRDARTLAQLLRADPRLLSPIEPKTCRWT